MPRKAEAVDTINLNYSQPSVKTSRVNDGDGGVDANNRCEKQLKNERARQRRERSLPTRLSSWRAGIRPRNLCSAVLEHVLHLVGSESPRSGLKAQAGEPGKHHVASKIPLCLLFAATATIHINGNSIQISLLEVWS